LLDYVPVDAVVGGVRIGHLIKFDGPPPGTYAYTLWLVGSELGGAQLNFSAVLTRFGVIEIKDQEQAT
jgi:hypothetical protein